ASTTDPASSAHLPASRPPTLPGGRVKVVMCLDRDPPNFGFVELDSGDEAEIVFKPGQEDEWHVRLHRSILRNQDGSELTDGHSPELLNGEWPPLRLGELPPVEPFPLTP